MCIRYSLTKGQVKQISRIESERRNRLHGDQVAISLDQKVLRLEVY